MHTISSILASTPARRIQRPWWLVGIVLIAVGCEHRVISTKGIGTSAVSTSQPNAPERSLGDLLLGNTRIRQAPPPTMRAWPRDSKKTSR